MAMKGWLGSVLGGRAKEDGPAAAPDPQAAAAARTEAAAHWAARLDEAECRAALAAWQRAVAADPGDHASFLGLARGHFFLADLAYALRRDAGEKAATKLAIAELDAGAQAALRGLRACGVQPDAPAGIGAEHVALAFWWAQSTMLAANARGVSDTVRQFNPVLKVMERVAALESGIWYGAPDRYLATVFCVAPAYTGGNPEKGRKHFEASLKYAPEFFDTSVLFAQLYARPTGDEALYTKLLTHVVETPADVLPEVVPEQTLAQRKAQAELARGFHARR